MKEKNAYIPMPKGRGITRFVIKHAFAPIMTVLLALSLVDDFIREHWIAILIFTLLSGYGALHVAG